MSLPEKQLFVFCPYHFNFLPPFPQKNCAAIRALIVRYLSSIMLPNCSAILYGKHDCRSILLSETFVCLGFGNFQSADLIPDYSTVDAQKKGVPIDLCFDLDPALALCLTGYTKRSLTTTASSVSTQLLLHPVLRDAVLHVAHKFSKRLPLEQAVNSSLTHWLQLPG